MIWLLANRSMDAAEMGVEIERGLRERGVSYEGIILSLHFCHYFLFYSFISNSIYQRN